MPVIKTVGEGRIVRADELKETIKVSQAHILTIKQAYNLTVEAFELGYKGIGLIKQHLLTHIRPVNGQTYDEYVQTRWINGYLCLYSLTRQVPIPPQYHHIDHHVYSMMMLVEAVTRDDTDTPS